MHAACAVWRCSYIFSLAYHCSFLSLSLGWVDGWRDFMSFSTEFQLYQDDGGVIDGYGQWNPVYDYKYPRLKWGLNPGPLEQQAGA